MKVTESIFDNGKVLIPMADVSHIEYCTHPTIGKNGLFVISKHTKWDTEADIWSNAAHIHEEDKADFLAAYCRFRNELDGIEYEPQTTP